MALSLRTDLSRVGERFAEGLALIMGARPNADLSRTHVAQGNIIFSRTPYFPAGKETLILKR